MPFHLFPKTPGRDSIMYVSYLAICLPRRIKKKPIDGRSANKPLVGQKLEMSIWSGSNYLTLAGKSRFWYQIAPGALRPGFMSILVLQSFWWGRESWLLCLVCLPGVSWWLCVSSSRCHRFVFGLWLWYFLIILTYFFWQNLEPDLDPNCSSLYAVSTYYYIRNQATGVSLAGR